MATFEGPLLSIKSVNGLAHYTDWIVGHVHAGALGWNGFMAAGMFYWMIPRLFGTKLYSKALADLHFWIGTVGILLYVISMWVSGVTQGLMLLAEDPNGGLLYPSFIETLIAIRPMYWVRLAGGTMYLIGMFLMAYNLYKTARQGKAVDGQVDVVVLEKTADVPWTNIVFSGPIILITVLAVMIGAMAVVDAVASVSIAALAVVLAVLGAMILQARRGKVGWHRVLEGRPLLLTAFAIVAVLIGGIAEIVPTIVSGALPGPTSTTQKPYTALELEGRDIYIREGCYNCHSQMIRSMVPEALRYGDPSTLEESQYDHPFQWGSKRTGPDLARIGGKYPALWHYRHMIDPRSTSPGSNMPTYAFLSDDSVNRDRSDDKLAAMKRIGVPYTDAEIRDASADQARQADLFVAELAKDGALVRPESEMVAIIAYLQRLGVKPGAEAPAAAPAAPAGEH